MSLGDIGISTVNGGAIGVKNAIINGNFSVNQREVSGTVSLTAGVYGHDRWKAGNSGCTYTFATSGNVTTLTITAGSLIQVVEGNNLFTGTYTLSWVGTAQGKIGAGSYSASGVTGSVTGGSNLNIEFNTGTLSLVQFEPGAVATPFERRLQSYEVSACEFYYRVISLANLRMIGQAYTSGAHECWLVTLPQEMRASPTWSADLSVSASARIGTNPTPLSSTKDSYVFYIVSNTTTNLTDFTFSSTAKIIASAEL
jgi:hypothetical protein